tara:strand:+ start:743 stop:1465 length:723 start_codon:yes stop_codon:yes gene_type:complete
VNVDWRLVLFELLNFGILMFLLSKFLFRPVRAALAARKAEREQVEAGVLARQAEAEGLRETYQGKLAGAAAEGEALVAEIRREAEAKAEQVVEAARRDMSRDRERLEADLEQIRARSLEALRDQVVALAVEGAGRVVSGMAEPSVAVAYARAGARRLLETAVVPEGETVKLWASPEANLEEVLAAVREVFQGRAQVVGEVEEALVGGVRFAFHDLEVEASAGASLGAWLSGATQESEVAA